MSYFILLSLTVSVDRSVATIRQFAISFCPEVGGVKGWLSWEFRVRNAFLAFIILYTTIFARLALDRHRHDRGNDTSKRQGNKEPAGGRHYELLPLLYSYIGTFCF